ncbi:MAG: DUF2029 domain-containing protein [Clostridia bacterium]|nr:DUF2029 domain-containing protein [Clostridia bacterium]
MQQIKALCLRARDGLVALLRRRDPAEYFIALMLPGLLIFLLRCLLGGADAFIGIFFKECSDLFMDFFNPVRDTAQGIEVYTRLGSIYPPLSNLVISLFSLFIPREYLDTPRELAHTWREYPAAILCYVFFFVVCFALLAVLLWREPYSGKKRAWLVPLMLCSFPMLFLLERGNTMLLCVCAMLLYVQSYHSESRIARELGLVALALATALKFYPVLLGAMLIADKRWRDALHACIYGLLCLFVPSFFYGGPISVFWAIKYTLGFSRASSQLSVDFMQQNNIPLQLGGSVLFGFYIFIILLAAVTALLQKKAWKSFLFCGAVMLTMPSIFSSYNWLLLLPALVLFLRTERLQGTNWIYFFAIALPFFTYPPRVLQDALLVVCLLAIYAAYLIETGISFAEFLRSKKKAVR